MLYQILKKIKLECAPSFLLLTRKKYPFCVSVLCNFILIPIFIFQIYRISYDWNIAYSDIQYCFEILFPIISIICPVIIFIDYYYDDWKEIIRLYKNKYIIDVLCLYFFQIIQVLLIFGYLSLHLSDIWEDFFHLAVVILFYCCLFYLLVEIFENVVISFLIIMLYHYFGLVFLDNTNCVIKFLFFIGNENMTAFQYLCYISICCLFFISCIIIQKIKYKYLK